MKKTAIALLSLIFVPISHAEDFMNLEQFEKFEGWSLLAGASMSEKNPRLLELELGEGNMLNNGARKNKAGYLTTKKQFGDQVIKAEFMIPSRSNSGFYVAGRYEIQVFDSFGKKKIKSSDMGSLYQRWHDKAEPGKNGYEGVPAMKNAAKPAGEWQSLEISFRAPRFDKEGEKVANALFLKVILNGELVLENVEAKGPTRGSRIKGEAAVGPLAIQGDHGPIVIRKLEITEEDFSASGVVK